MAFIKKHSFQIILFVFAILVGLYCFSFLGLFHTATTTDYANFGTYINGIATPLSIVLSTIAIGKQIRKTEEISKLERLNKEHSDITYRVEALIKTIGTEYIQELEYKAHYIYSIGGDVLLDDSDVAQFYETHSRLLFSISLLRDLLQQIKDIDTLAYNTSRSRTFAHIERDVYSKLERVNFYLDAVRYKVSSENYFWLCKESTGLSKK